MGVLRDVRLASLLSSSASSRTIGWNICKQRDKTNSREGRARQGGGVGIRASGAPDQKKHSHVAMCVLRG